MNKAQLATEIATLTGLTTIKSAETIDALVTSITTALKSGNKVSLVGFGSFDVVHKSARIGRNPKTGEVIQIAATTSPKFTAGKILKESVARYLVAV